MSQINSNFQEIISNNRTAIISSEALQGFSMANQFAICANSGNGPVLLSCLTPMLLPTLAGTSKSNFELSGNDGRGQGQPQMVQIQLASPFNFSNNAQSLPSLGVSYINLSSLANAGNGIPFQLTLNNVANNNGSHQITIPTATLNNLSQDVQIAQNYQINSQIKFEPELSVTTNHQQQNISSQVPDISNIDDKIKRKPRRRIPNKSNKTMVAINGTENPNTNNVTPNTEERLMDHKGRPFIYNCPNCPKKFTLNSRLTAHLRCHTGIRPYTCTQCGFSFTQKSYLIRHAAVHTEERPFTCERCMKTYKHYGSLANHRKLHRKEDKNDGCTSEISDSDHKEQSCLVATNATSTANFDNIIQLHSDWSTVVSTMNENDQNTYLITNNTNTTNNASYYTESAANLTVTGPVAFPDQDVPSSTVVANTTASINNNVTANQSTIFMDLTQMNEHNTNNNNIIYTHLDLSCDQSQSIQSQQL